MANTKKKKIVKNNVDLLNNTKKTVKKNIKNSEKLTELKQSKITEKSIKTPKKENDKNKISLEKNAKATKNKTNTSSEKTKKSNYTKIQDKVLQNKKILDEKEKVRKQNKQNKQVERNIKKEKEKESRSLKRKIFLLILSSLIKFKNFIISFLIFIKKVFIIIFHLIINIPIVFKRLFEFIKLKLNFSNKSKKKTLHKKKKDFKKLKPKKQIIEDEYIPKKVLKWEKKSIYTCSQKPFRSFTGRVLPSTFLKGDRKLRKTYYLKESLLFTIFITLINFIGFYRIKKIDMLHIFDNSLWNVLLTLSLTILVMFIGCFFIDYFTTEILLRFRKRKK